MKRSFIGELQHMAEDDLRALVPQDVVDGIKASGDESPLFNVYSIAHEGEADAAMVTAAGKMSVKMQYMREAVEKFAGKVARGVKAFFGHGATNDHAGRESIGQVVGQGLREIGGKLHALAAIYIRPEHRGKDLDRASFEAEMEFERTSDDSARALNVSPITGIALFSSKEHTAAFPGATLRAAFQYWAETLTSKEGETVEITLDQIKEAVKAGNITPSQVFGQDAILNEEAVKAEFERVRKENQEKYESKAQYAERQTKRLEEAEAKLEAAEAAKREMQTAVTRQKTGDVFAERAKARNLTDKQRDFAARSIKEFSPEVADEATLAAKVDEYIEAKLKEYDDVAKLLGVKVETQEPGGTPGAPDGDGKTPTGDMTDPKTNPLIPVD